MDGVFFSNAFTNYQSGALHFRGSSDSCAMFSYCDRYRYYLWRRLSDGPAKKIDYVAFVGLNPSTADETVNDPTIRRCINFAKFWGYEGMYMLNAFAYRATDPKEMKKQANPLGDFNRQYLNLICAQAALVVAAWGNHVSDLDQMATLQAIGRKVHCFDKTKAGRPKHPLYCRSDTVLKVFWVPGPDSRPSCDG